eukprot:scaffold125414_cov60-Phaeocystis_antarctica.AAC.3
MALRCCPTPPTRTEGRGGCLEGISGSPPGPGMYQVWASLHGWYALRRPSPTYVTPSRVAPRRKAQSKARKPSTKNACYLTVNLTRYLQLSPTDSETDY